MRKETWTSIILAGTLLAGVTACERAGEPTQPGTSGSPPARQEQPSSPPSSPSSQPEKQQPGGTQK